MTRSDRLFALIQILRDGRLHRGKDLANALKITPRTLYRDMDTLMKNGIPVEGEAGIGYIMSAPITLPPLNLRLEELEALHLGLEVVSRSSDTDIAEAAKTLADKVDAALPEDRSVPANGWGFAVYPFPDAAHSFAHIAPLRAAIRTRRKVQITCTDDTAHTLRPLKIEYWGRIWTLTGWSEKSNDFIELRVDHVAMLDVEDQTFEEEPGKRLADYQDREDG